jgi:hypothetical protein
MKLVFQILWILATVGFLGTVVGLRLARDYEKAKATDRG